MRARTLEEIRSVARELLVEHGHGGLTGRAIARRMGMSSPALYRYFDSHDELEDAILADLFDELSTHLRQAADQVADGGALAKLVGASRELRGWALRHVREFEFMLIHPMAHRTKGAEQLRARREFGGVMLSLLAAAARPSAMRTEQPEPSREAVAAMVDYCANCGVQLDPAVAPAAVQCWVRLYGSVAMVAMGQLDPLGAHAAAVFEQELGTMVGLLGYSTADLPPPSAELPDPRLATG